MSSPYSGINEPNESRDSAHARRNAFPDREYHDERAAEAGQISMNRPTNIFISPPLEIVRGPAPFERADIVVEGIDQRGPSFELRLFINNPNADEETPLQGDTGYAGSIFVYGRGERSGSPIPLDSSIEATPAIRQGLARTEPLTVTAVAVPYGTTSPSGAGLRLDLKNIAVDLDPSYE